jgi:hypothetical protein
MYLRFGNSRCAEHWNACVLGACKKEQIIALSSHSGYWHVAQSSLSFIARFWLTVSFANKGAATNHVVRDIDDRHIVTRAAITMYVAAVLEHLHPPTCLVDKLPHSLPSARAPEHKNSGVIATWWRSVSQRGMPILSMVICCKWGVLRGS